MTSKKGHDVGCFMDVLCFKSRIILPLKSVALLRHLFALSNFSKLANLEAIPALWHVDMMVWLTCLQPCWNFGFVLILATNDQPCLMILSGPFSSTAILAKWDTKQSRAVKVCRCRSLVNNNSEVSSFFIFSAILIFHDFPMVFISSRVSHRSHRSLEGLGRPSSVKVHGVDSHRNPGAADSDVVNEPATQCHLARRSGKKVRWGWQK